MYRHFIFDIDGTLIDTEKTGVLSLIKTVKELMDVDMPYEQAYKFFGVPSGGVGAVLGYHEPAYFSHCWEQNFIALSDMIQPFEGVGQMLAAVKAARRTIGCVTSRNLFEFNKDIHFQKLLHYFDCCITAEDSTTHKPEPGPILAFLDKVGATLGEKIDPRECIYIGDTISDEGCAHGAGCDFALVDWRSRGQGSIPAEYYFTRMSQILDLLKL